MPRGKVTTVGRLGEGYQFLTDSQDVQSVRTHLGLDDSYDAYYVKTDRGEYTVVWGMVGIVPYLSKLVTRLK